MENQKKESNYVSDVEILYYLSAALKNGTDGRFLALEHASSIFKAALREAGFEPAKSKTVVEEK